MAALKFNENVCSTCPTADCLVKCQYMKFGVKEAHGEMMKVVKGEDSPVLQNVSPVMPVRNIAPEVIIPSISSKSVGKKKGIYTAPRPITNQWINMTLMQGKQMVGAVKDKAVSCCFIPALGESGNRRNLQGGVLGHGVRGRVHVPGRSQPFCQDVGHQRETSCGYR